MTGRFQNGVRGGAAPFQQQDYGRNESHKRDRDDFNYGNHAVQKRPRIVSLDPEDVLDDLESHAFWIRDEKDYAPAVLELQAPKSCEGLLRGRRDKTLEGLREVTKCIIMVEDIDARSIKVIIRGEVLGVTQVVHMVAAAATLESTDRPVDIFLLVPHGICGAIVGRAGVNLGKLMKISRARSKLHQEIVNEARQLQITGVDARDFSIIAYEVVRNHAFLDLSRDVCQEIGSGSGNTSASNARDRPPPSRAIGDYHATQDHHRNNYSHQPPPPRTTTPTHYDSNKGQGRGGLFGSRVLGQGIVAATHDIQIPKQDYSRQDTVNSFDGSVSGRAASSPWHDSNSHTPFNGKGGHGWKGGKGKGKGQLGHVATKDFHMDSGKGGSKGKPGIGVFADANKNGSGNVSHIKEDGTRFFNTVTLETAREWYVTALDELIDGGFIHSGDRDDVECKLEILCPDEFVPAVCGHKGECVKEIKRIAEVDFESQWEMATNNDPKLRLCSLSGRLRNIMMAVHMMQKIMGMLSENQVTQTSPCFMSLLPRPPLEKQFEDESFRENVESLYIFKHTKTFTKTSSTNLKLLPANRKGYRHRLDIEGVSILDVSNAVAMCIRKLFPAKSDDSYLPADPNTAA